jgi:type I restriction enzyme S subunit
VNWISISDAPEGAKYITNVKRRIIPEGVKRSRMVYPGDFLLTNSMSFGRPYILKTEGCIHDGWLVLSPRDTRVDPDFFFYLLSSDAVYAEFERLAAGATVKNLNIDLVKGIKIPLPPLPEQRRIAEVLDRAEGLRAKRIQIINKIDFFVQSTFQYMFGDPTSNPKKWPIFPIGKIAVSITNGMTRRNKESEMGNNIVLRLRDIRPNFAECQRSGSI